MQRKSHSSLSIHYGIFAGDFNLYTSNEKAYIKATTNTTASVKMKDPMALRYCAFPFQKPIHRVEMNPGLPIQNRITIGMTIQITNTSTPRIREFQVEAWMIVLILC